jgi:hypothetical protein
MAELPAISSSSERSEAPRAALRQRDKWDNQVYVVDWRMNEEYAAIDVLLEWMPQFAKKWVFQLEQGEQNEYRHWQGRMSMHKKAFKNEVLQMFRNSIGYAPNDVSPTHDAKSFSYVMKLQTRIEGPWRDDKEALYMPPQYEMDYESMYPYQKVIYDSREVYDKRHINFVYCPSGNIGKSTIAHHMFFKGLAYMIPPYSDGDKISQFFCSYLSTRKVRDPKVVFLDCPRSMKQYKMSGIYRAIESIKCGCVTDTRYGGTIWGFKSPQVWVFSNEKPYIKALSQDRWKVWEVNEKMEFVEMDVDTILGKRGSPEECPVLFSQSEEEE